MNPCNVDRRSTRVLARLGLSLLLVALVAAPAFGHGELESTIPEENSTLKRPTDHIIINFTEPPAKPSVVAVRDGCNDDIIDEVEFEDRVAHVFLTKGEPGRWKVSYQVVSAADGHRTKGSYSLNVKGKADCSPGSGDGGGDGAGDGGGDGDGTAAGPGGPGGTSEDESSFPIVPIALGSAVVIALALVARRLSG